MSINLDLLEEILIYTLNNDILANIFKDFIWGIIRYKEDNWEDTSERLRGFIEHAHKALYEKLIGLTSNPFYLNEYEKSAKNLYNKLRKYIFWDLSINQTILLDENRQNYEYLATKFHKIISYANKSKFIPIIDNCIKLLLLTEEIFFYINENKTNKLKSIRIETKYQDLFNLKEIETIETFLDAVFSRQIRDLLIKKSILDYIHIQNSRFLQQYYPYYIIDHLRIENLLSETKVYPFRPTGPHIIDFEQGTWVYIPINARLIMRHLEITQESILLSSFSGAGKTVISRWVGYKLFKKGFSVFYIDCLELKAKKIESILDQIIILKGKNPTNTLFIFENIHIMDDDLKNKLTSCKNLTLCLLTERIIEEEEEKRGVFRQKFKEYQKLRILINHWNFKKTIKGIINLNSTNNNIINQLRHIGNQNLWIYAIILKLFKESSKFNQNSSIISILADNQQIGEKISDYFQNLLEKKPIKILSSKKALYLNHIHYFLGILSIFSENELWTEESFFDYLVSIKNETPLGLYNSDMNINKEVLKEVQAFLIDLFEINERTVNIKPGIKQKEFKIPHSQMAIIYRNSILKIIEKSYPNLQQNIYNLYIFHGNYYGHLLDYKYQKVYHVKRKPPKPGETFSLSECKRYTGKKDMDSFLNKFFENIKKNSLEEINIFTERCLYSKCIEDKEQEYINLQLEKLLVLDNYYWELKINNTNPRTLFYFLENIEDYLGGKSLVQFFNKYETIIMEKMAKSKLNLIIKLMFILFKEPENIIEAFHKNFKELILRNDETFDEFMFSINHIEENSLTNNYISSILKEKLTQYLLKSNLEIDIHILSRYSNRREFFFSIYEHFLEKVVNERNFTKLFKEKLFKSDLNQLCTFTYTLADVNSKALNRIVIVFFEDIKNLFEKSDLKSIAELLVEIKFTKHLFDNFKKLFINNWDWFLNLISKFNAYDILSNYNSISKHFLIEIGPSYKNKFEIFIKSIIFKKIQNYYNSLNKKYEIYKLLIKNDLLSDIKDEIYSFITISLKNNLENPSINLDKLFNIFAKFQSNNTAFSIFKTDYNFDVINSNKNFKVLIENAQEDSLFKFLGFLKDKANNWFKKFSEKHNNFLKEKYGNGFEVAHLCSKKGREYLKKIPMLVKQLDIESINLIYNSTFRTWYPITTSFKATDDLIEIHNVFLREISQNINSHRKLFISDEMGVLLTKINSTALFNFIIILHKFHPNLLEDIYNKFQQTILDNLRTLPIEPLILFRILENYEISMFKLKEFMNSFFKKGIFSEILTNSLKLINLFSLRVYITYLSSPHLTKKDRSDEIELLKEKINFNESIKNSNLLQIALALHQDSISILKKPSGLAFLKGQKRIRQVRLEPNEFDMLTKDMAFFWYDKDKKLTYISLNEFFPYNKEIILKIPIFYANFILEKIKVSNFHDIFQYFKTLESWIEEIDERLLTPPLEFLTYFNSDSFFIKIKEAWFEDILSFFEVCVKHFPIIARDLWVRHQSYFKKEDFINKLKKKYYRDVYKFYTLNYKDLNQVPLDIIEIIKEFINYLDFEKLIWVFADLGEIDFEFHLVNFKKNLEVIVQKSSRQEIVQALRKYRYFEKNNDRIDLLINKIPFIDIKMKEKYFFE